MGVRGLLPAFLVSEDSMYRKPVNKRASAAQFKKNVRRTKAPNLRAAPMRGGIRL